MKRVFLLEFNTLPVFDNVALKGKETPLICFFLFASKGTKQTSKKDAFADYCEYLMWFEDLKV